VNCADLQFDQINVGDKAQLAWTPAEADIDRFAALSGDENPLHMDGAYARDHGFQGRVVHGFLLGAKVSALVGMILPGRRCLLLDYELSHPNPIYAGDDVHISAEVRERWPDLSLIELGIKATKQVDGKAKTIARGSVKCKILS
jgi:acyl dehydratase